MSKYPVINEEEDFIIIHAPVSAVMLTDYDSHAWTAFSDETLKKVAEKKKQAKQNPKMFDGPLARVNNITVKDGIVGLDTQRTSFFPFVESRDNDTGNREQIKPEPDCANPLSVGALTINMDAGIPKFWLGVKSDANEIGADQKQLSPAGYVNPVEDFSHMHATLREAFEEMLYLRGNPDAETLNTIKVKLESMLKRSGLEKLMKGQVHDLQTSIEAMANIEYERTGERMDMTSTMRFANSIYDSLIRVISKQMLTPYYREPLEVGSKLVYQQPFAIIDRYQLRNPWVLHIVGLDMKDHEIQESLKAQHIMFNVLGKEWGISKPEFTSLEPVRLEKAYVQDWYAENLPNLRPHARGSIQALLNEFDYVEARISQAFEVNEKLKAMPNL